MLSGIGALFIHAKVSKQSGSLARCALGKDNSLLGYISLTLSNENPSSTDIVKVVSYRLFSIYGFSFFEQIARSNFVPD